MYGALRLSQQTPVLRGKAEIDNGPECGIRMA
jgi:hypothetical protein